MSNNEVAVPDYLKAYMDGGVKSSDTDALTDVKTSVPRISLKGKRFKFINGDDESKSTDTIEAVILAVEPAGGLMAKTFYKSGYNSSDTSPPDCASSNGISPDPWIAEPVSDRCSTCPNNMFGSATSTSGKKAKACKDSKMLWVVKPDDIEGTVYGLKVPVTSLKAMSEFGQRVKAAGVPLSVVIAQLTMDQDAEFPVLSFNMLGYLNADCGPTAIERSEKREWIQATRKMEALDYKANAQISTSSKANEAVTIDGDAKDVSAESAASLAKGW